MATLVEILQTLYDELKAAVSGLSAVGDPNDHVGVLQRTKDYTTPFFGFEWNSQPTRRGFGGNKFTESVNKSGSSVDVEYRSEYTHTRLSIRRLLLSLCQLRKRLTLTLSLMVIQAILTCTQNNTNTTHTHGNYLRHPWKYS